MKILILSHSGSVTGGAEQCLLEYVDVLSSAGHKCKVVVPSKGEMTRVLSTRKIESSVVGFGWAIKPHRNVHPHRILRSTGNSLVRIFQEVEKFKPDVLITNTSVIPWGLYAGKIFGIPTILLVHEILNDKDPSLNMVPSYEEYVDILNKNTDYVIYNSKFVKTEFSKAITLPKTANKILYPLPPLDTATIDRFYKENVIGKKLKIAIFGALSPRKNQLEALKAAKILKDRGYEDFTIDLYGDKTANPTYTKLLRRYITQNALSTNVKIKGFTTSVYEKMNEYNVVLSAATYEPFGRTIIEGQLLGRVVVTNDTGGGPELVEDARTGLVYKLGDPDQLADKLVWIMKNNKKALAIALTAKNEQLKKYINDSRYDALIESVDYFAGSKFNKRPQNIFDPLMSLYEYNHQLNNTYKHLYRITHNRVTYRLKNIIWSVLIPVKKTLKQIIS